jgi:uncharacterized protein (TIGR03089 family)
MSGILPSRDSTPYSAGMSSPETFPEALAAQLRTDAARPLVTFYDDATGERVELSVTTYANWVAKTSALVQDELDVEHGGTLQLDLPTHWLAAVWLGAAWTVGLSVTPDAAASADLVVCGPDTVDEHAGRADRAAVVALSLRPLGGRFTEPLEAGVIDYGAVVLGQPDAFSPLEPPTGDDPAWSVAGTVHTQRKLLAEAASWPGSGAGARVLTDVAPGTRDGVLALVGAVATGGSLVLVRNPDESQWQRRHHDERATAQLRA